MSLPPRTDLSAAFAAFPVIGILRGLAPEVTLAAAQAAAEAGLAALEVTLSRADALDQIRALRAALGAAVQVGAGTVLDADQARQALAAGAQFLVSPVVDAGVMAVGQEAGVPLFPGALTPTEVLAAWRAGATMVKVFPANPLGPAYLKALRAPLRGIPLLPTGGVGLHNLDAFLEAGAAGAGVGEPLFDPERLRAGDWPWLRQRVRLFRGVFEGRRVAGGGGPRPG
jgi:2-dehydro-3-deoxyphosphogluconate aldolase/(4S)-4-hydroxy-2-oxoglutarate aldolase